MISKIKKHHYQMMFFYFWLCKLHIKFQLWTTSGFSIYNSL